MYTHMARFSWDRLLIVFREKMKMKVNVNTFFK